MEELQTLLDLDRAESAFSLLFTFLRDGSSESEEEGFASALAAILRGLKIPPGAEVKLRRIYDAVHNRPTDLEEVMGNVVRDFGGQREVLLALISLLLRVISDEGMISRRHCSDLRQVLTKINFTSEEFETFDDTEKQLLAFAFSGTGFGEFSLSARELAKYYDTLGCRPDVSDAELRRSYRQLAMKYHPDRSAALALGEKSKREQNRRFQRIQAAYDALSRARMTRA